MKWLPGTTFPLCARSLEFSHVMTLSWKSEIMSVLNKAEDCQCSVVLLIGCEINHWVCFLVLALDSKNKIGHLHLSLGKISKNKSHGNYTRDVERGMGDVLGISKKCQQLEAAFWDVPLRYDIFLCVSQDWGLFFRVAAGSAHLHPVTYPSCINRYWSA